MTHCRGRLILTLLSAAIACLGASHSAYPQPGGPLTAQHYDQRVLFRVSQEGGVPDAFISLRSGNNLVAGVPVVTGYDAAGTPVLVPGILMTADVAFIPDERMFTVIAARLANGKIILVAFADAARVEVAGIQAAETSIYVLLTTTGPGNGEIQLVELFPRGTSPMAP